MGSPGNSTWAEGDWNCDQEATTSDFVWALKVNEISVAATPHAASLIHDAALRLALESFDPQRFSLTDSFTQEHETAVPDVRQRRAQLASPSIQKEEDPQRRFSVEKLFSRPSIWGASQVPDSISEISSSPSGATEENRD